MNVFPLPVISGGLTTNSPLCENDTLTINAPVVVDATYAWTGPNGYSSAGQNITINNVIETDHQGLYTVVVTDNNGCQSLPLSTLVLINALPDAGIALNSGPVCEGEEVQFTVLEIFNATYSWSGPNGFTSSIYNPTLTTTFADTGVYTVDVTVNNCSASYSTELSLNPNPVAVAAGDTTIELGQSTTIAASGGLIVEDLA